MTESNYESYPQQHSYQPQNIDNEEKSMLYMAHLSAPVAFLVSAGWLSFIGPLVIWLIYKDKSQAVRTASAGAFNFNLTMTLISWTLWLSVFITFGIGLIWAIPGWIILFIIQLICHLKGVSKTNSGQVYDYPAQIRILS